MPTKDMQVRAARELLRWDQKKLSDASSLSLATIRRFETGHEISEDAIAHIIQTLERADVIFVEASVIEGKKVSIAIGVKPSAKPEPAPVKRQYNYLKPAGRPKMTKEP